MQPIAFSNERYMSEQTECIMRRIAQFDNKLYLEVGGKLFDDGHAARVLPGYAPDNKTQVLRALADQMELIVVVAAPDIEEVKVRGDSGITYEDETLRLLDAFRGLGLLVESVVVTRYEGQAAADRFRTRLQDLGLRVYIHHPIPGYPSEVDFVASADGLGRNDFVSTQRPLVAVTAPGPGSGKMAVCISQLYHEHRRGVRAGYAKFETFPVWNLPLKHPLNLAYEAATADLQDVNIIDPFHLEAYGVAAVNYNRDVEAFPVLSAILCRVMGRCPYASPTDMGVNVVACCITDDEGVRRASQQEIVRRLYTALCDRKHGHCSGSTVDRLRNLVAQAGITAAIRTPVCHALARARETGCPAVALELGDGTIVTGRQSDLLSASAALLLNALKALGGISAKLDLLAGAVLEPVLAMKEVGFRERGGHLMSGEVLIALSICAVTNPSAKLALDQLTRLRDCEAHSSVILPQVEVMTLRKLGIRLTCEPVFWNTALYQEGY